MAATLRVCVLLMSIGFLVRPALSNAAVVMDANATATNAFQAKVTALLNQLPPLQIHYEGLCEPEAADRARGEQSYQTFLREKLQGHWFAALTDIRAGNSYSVQGRFETWTGLMDFLVER